MASHFNKSLTVLLARLWDLEICWFKYLSYVQTMRFFRLINRMRLKACNKLHGACDITSNNSPPCFQARLRTARQWRRGPILEFSDHQTPSLCQPHGLLHHGLWVHFHFLHHILHRGGGAGNKGSQMVVLQQHLQHTGSCRHHSK